MAPDARVEVVRESRFGVELVDPYRWMEAEDVEFRGWVAGQAARSRERLEALPDRAALLARITELGAVTTVSGLAVAGEATFHLRQEPDDAVPVLVLREEAAERVLLDPATLPGAEHSSLDWYVPSPDGRYVACGISQGGAENGALHVLDTGTGTLRAQGIEGTRHGYLSWLDAESFVYHRYRDAGPEEPVTQRRTDSRSLLHRLGTDAAADQLVLARGLNPRVELTARDRPFVVAPYGSAWVVAVISHSALGRTIDALTDCSIYVAPRSGLVDPASCPWTLVAAGVDGVSGFALSGDQLYLVTYRGAGRRQVLAVPCADPDLSRATVVVPASDRVVEAVEAVGEHLLVRDLDAGVARLRRVPLAGGEPEEVPLPLAGTVLEWAGRPDRAEALLLLASWTQPPRVCRYDGGSGTVTDAGWSQVPPAAGFDDVVVTDVEVPARDGTPIPLTLIHREGLLLDGDNPTVLAGYGSYGISLRPRYDPGWLAWYERGGIQAVAHLRGGGELGRGWHEAGRLRHKENTITDFIDCAEHLVAAGYTRPGRLAGQGASAGGIPTGGALVRRPDLWAAMLMLVPAVNLTRQEFSENGPINIPEFGTVTTEDGLRALLVVDAYLRIRDGADYPAVLLTAGMHDPRVTPWQPAKMAARLQAATASGRPVLLRVDEHAGHGFGSTRGQRDALLADQLAFALAAFD